MVYFFILNKYLPTTIKKWSKKDCQSSPVSHRNHKSQEWSAEGTALPSVCPHQGNLAQWAVQLVLYSHSLAEREARERKTEHPCLLSPSMPPFQSQSTLGPLEPGHAVPCRDVQSTVLQSIQCPLGPGLGSCHSFFLEGASYGQQLMFYFFTGWGVNFLLSNIAAYVYFSVILLPYITSFIHANKTNTVST
jgi:hypothetical protein